MTCRTSWPIFACLVCLAAPCHLWAQLTGAFADGNRFQGVQLIAWPDAKAQPRLKETANPGRDLGPVFDDKNPVAWLCNERVEVSSVARPCVELFGGDRVPGQVVGYRYGMELPVDRQPPHLLLKLDPDAARSPHALIRIRVQAVRKVIWQPRRSASYTPATLYYLDGRRTAFRALRWTVEGVTLLLQEGGTSRVGFSEIAELHLPRRDPWQVYHETLAVLSPDCSARLMRIETSRGLVLSGTMAHSRVDSTVHLIQPAWSLDPLGFAHSQLRWWRFFWPHEVPLSCIEPVRVQQRSPLEGTRSWQADQNVKLQALRSGGRLYARGFGMQADSELEFELPAGVRSFQAHVGMDEQAGRSGCGRGRVHVNLSKDKAVWQSEVMVGSREPTATGRLALQGPAQGQKTLILVAEAPTERPAEADPLNIRSFVDWLEPQIELDLDRLRSDVQRLVPETISAWQGWTVSTNGGGRLRLAQRWDVRDPTVPRFVFDAVIQGGSLLLTRQLEVGPKQDFLCLALHQEPGTPAGWVVVRVDGRPLGELTIPVLERGPADHWLIPPAFFVPLAKYRGKTVQIEVEHMPAGESATVHWSGLELVPSKDLVTWTPVEVVEARATAPDTTLVREPEHTIFAVSRIKQKLPRTDTYTVIADSDLADITALRLELLPDPRLPYNGPGRGDGWVFLSEFKVKAAPRARPDQAEAVTLTAAGTDSYPDFPVGATVDGKGETGWLPVPPGRTHIGVFTPAQNIAFPGGARLTFTLEQNLAHDKSQAGRSPGRFRLLATGAPRPVPVARPGIVLEPPGRKTVFEDEYDFVRQLNHGPTAPVLETKEKYSGTASLKITDGPQFHNSRFLGEIRIRRNPGRGEFRYIQFAWKKTAGAAIGLQLARDGGYGRAKADGPSYRYHAGTDQLWGKDSLQVSDKVPTDWVLVTRDLAEDFAEFTLTGLSLDSRGNADALFDHIRLGRTLDDFKED